MKFDLSNTCILPNMYAGIVMEDSSYTLEDYLKDSKNWLSFECLENYNVKVFFEDFYELLDISNGFIIQSMRFSYDSDKCLSYSLFTSYRYLTKDYDSDSVSYFSPEGSLLLLIKNGDWYSGDGDVIDSDCILAELLDNLSPNVIIRDNFGIVYPFLREYALANGIKYAGYLHFSPLITDCLPDSIKYADYDLIVSCNPDMISYIKTDNDIKVVYSPPIFVDEVTLNRGSTNKFLMLTSNVAIKNLELVFDWFSTIHDVELDVYGVYGNSKYSNIHFKGFVHSDNIDWSKYKGYISNSKSEAFSIALVESLAKGCFPIVSDVDFAHRTWVLPFYRYKDKERFVDLVEYVKDANVSFNSYACATYDEYVVSFLKIINM